jgi:hypothetical protein
MGPAAVVVAGVRPQDSLEVPSAANERPVQALRSDRSDPSLGEGVGPRSPVRSPDDVDSYRAEDLVERPGELRVPIADEEDRRLDLTLDDQVPGLLSDPCALGMVCDAGETNPSGVKIDEEQDVESLQPDRLHGEEVGGEDAMCLGPQELRPGGTLAPRSGTEAVSTKNPSDGRRAHPDADLPQFSLDPEVTPPRVLPGEAEHECPDVWIDRRTSRLARGAVGPLPPDEFAVPPEQRLGRDEEGGPPVPRKDVSRGGEEDAIEGRNFGRRT